MFEDYPEQVEPRRRRARASTLTDDRNTRHDRPHRRRENASATDASLDDAGDRIPTNTLCPITRSINLLLDQYEEQLIRPRLDEITPHGRNGPVLPTGRTGPRMLVRF